MSSYKESLAKKKVNKSQLTKLKQKLTGVDLDVNDYELIREKLNKLKVELEDVFTSIYNSCDDKLTDGFITEQEELNETIDEMEFLLVKKIPKVKSKSENDANSHIETNLRLPKFNLPSYSGSLHDWLSFKDIFKASIHDNSNLSDAVKLQYLKSCLRGDAFKVIQSISIVDANYDLAWSLLEERYSNKREQVYAHLKKFLNVPCINNESATSILSLIDNTSECIRALEILEQKLDGFASIIFAFILSQKLDTNTKLWWERHMQKDNLPNINELLEFLRDHARTLSASKVSVIPKKCFPKVSTMISGVSNKNLHCILCSGENHVIENCHNYLKLPVNDKIEVIKSKRLCFNCLNPHNVSNCKQKNNCFCKKRHHRSIHFPRVDVKPSCENNNAQMPMLRDQTNLNASAPEYCPQTENRVNLMSQLPNKREIVFLSTVICSILDDYGNEYKVRCILDVGSESNFLTRKLVERLNLRKRKINIVVSGLNNSSQSVKFAVTANVCNEDKTFIRNLDFLVVPKIIADYTPSEKIDIHSDDFTNVKLADANFNIPGRVDMLLSAEVFYDLLISGQVRFNNSGIILQNTVFGYVASGKTLTEHKNRVHCGIIKESFDLDEALKKFWEVEQFDETCKFKSSEELQCNEHFLKTYTRNEFGNFVVEMPFKKEPSALGESKETALKCLNSLWKRLERNPILSSLYCQFMSEYEKLGHMEEVVESEEPPIVYYFPHHAIYRADKSSTKCRVVFNGSSKTSTGESLNSLQLNGGVIQDDLFAIILRFRLHRFAFIADIKMMYRMILINENQRNLQRILWKSGANEEVKTYKLCTVTYGTTSAPYLAMRCLKQLADDGREKYPAAAGVVESSFYMDDVLTGSDDVDSAKKLQIELIDLLKSCGMTLHKWCGNHEDLMKTVDKSDNYVFNSVETKVLGLIWNPREDTFSFKLSEFEINNVTKRSVISVIARIFDPLGILGPTITKAKIFLQNLWKLKIDWDQPLPQKEANEWLQFCESLKAINNINVERYMLLSNQVHISIVGFSDASEKAYGAALYIVVQSTETFSSKLICSKSRVAPVKTITVARLELCAAVILVKLMHKVVNTLKLTTRSVHFYTDSTIVLAWIRKSPSDLKTFVASRVTKIQELSNENQWRHVASKDNPADLISRGIDPECLQNCSLWFNGPVHLLQNVAALDSNLPYSEVDSEEYLQELKLIHKTSLLCSDVKNCDSFDFLNDFLDLTSNFVKLIRVLSFIFRFIYNCRTSTKLNGPLTNEEVSNAEATILHLVQQREFSEEIRCLKKGNPLKCNSKLRSLNVFLDSNNLIRLGGRIKNSNLEYNAKHPILLPGKHRLSRLICDYYHKKYFHIGPQSLLYFIRQKYWIIGGRNLTRKAVHECVTCFKAKPVTTEQIMGNLPRERLIPSFPFNYTGVDFAGPFLIKYKGQRKGTLHKIYISLFICLATKAIHLEIVSDLTSEAFVETLKRFIARRGKCAKLFSDNATNFVGAHNEIKKLHKLVSHPSEILANYLTSELIDWQFIPPRSPNFGGLWESGVKSIKHHLKRVIKDLKLTYEEFLTIVVQIEGILNSRPLSPLSPDPNELEVLTPGHFLIGRPITAIVEPELIQYPINRLKRWENIRRIIQVIWKKWSLDYLNNLQQRSKWFFEKNNVCVGQMVVIKEDHIPCSKWVLGRVIEVYPGSDGKIRVVKLRTSAGELKRPVTKIAVLPFES